MTKKTRRKEQTAWVLVDVGNSAFSTTVAAAIFPVYLPTLLPKGGVQFDILGLHWTSTALSLWAYTVSFSIFLTFLISPFLGAWADAGGKRKTLLSFFTAVGVVGTFALAFCDGWVSLLSAFVLANIGFSASNVFYNSLLANVAEDSEWDKLSLAGFAWGYIGGGILLAANLLFILKYEWFGLSSKTQGLKMSFVSVAIWWGLFTLPAVLWIREKKVVSVAAVERRFENLIKSLWKTLKSLPKNRNLLFFMIAFAFFNEGIQTVITMASIFGKEVLSLSEDTLIGTLLMIQFLGLPFTLSMNSLNRWAGPKPLLVLSLIFWLMIVAFSYNMTSAKEFWILGIMVSIVLGVSQALPRSIFTGLIPPNQQAEYFSFFALSGKVTSVLGPLTFGFVRDLTGNPRISILSLAAFFIIGLSFLSAVSIDRRRIAP